MASNCGFCSVVDKITSDGARRGYTGRAALLNSAFWGQGAKLTVGFLEGSVALQQRVAQIARRWSAETQADFSFEFWIELPRDPKDADIRIAFHPEKGSWSLLGRYALDVPHDKPTMNLGWMTTELADDEANSVVLHEFGHAIGLIHEHLNPTQEIDWNKTQVISDLKASQGWDEETIAANMFAYFAPSDVYATDVDPLSIMMYPIPPRWTNNGFSTGFNVSLTELDKSLVTSAYGARSPFALG